MMRKPFRTAKHSTRGPQPEAGEALRPEVRAAVVAFLRDWLPPEAREAYRRMIRDDPERWMNDPHFRGGVIVRHALRGNGLTEQALGVADLEPLWPSLLREAVEPEPATERPHAGPEGPAREATA